MDRACCENAVLASQNLLESKHTKRTSFLEKKLWRDAPRRRILPDVRHSLKPRGFTIL
jgi:hypothetical protein